MGKSSTLGKFGGTFWKGERKKGREGEKEEESEARRKWKVEGKEVKPLKCEVYKSGNLKFGGHFGRVKGKRGGRGKKRRKVKQGKMESGGKRCETTEIWGVQSGNLLGGGNFLTSPTFDCTLGYTPV